MAVQRAVNSLVVGSSPATIAIQGENMSHIVSILILPFVMAAGALHFLALGLCRLFKLRRAEPRVWAHLYALDVYANTLLGGHHKETISSRLGRGQNDGCLICSLLCKFLNIFDPSYCEKSLAAYYRENKNG